MDSLLHRESKTRKKKSSTPKESPVQAGDTQDSEEGGGKEGAIGSRVTQLSGGVISKTASGVESHTGPVDEEP